MDSTIIAAIIGGLSTVGAFIGTLLTTRLLDTSTVHIRHVRQIVLTGQWEGTAHQEVGPQGASADYRIMMQLKSTRRTIRGAGTWQITFPVQGTTRHIHLAGSFIHDRFLKMEYQMKNQPGAIQFGFILLELSPDTYTLNGRFLSFGASTQNLTWGTIQLHKQGIPLRGQHNIWGKTYARLRQREPILN